MGLKLVIEIGTSYVFLAKNDRKSKWKLFRKCTRLYGGP